MPKLVDVPGEENSSATKGSSKSLTDLPPEIVLKIMECLDVESALKLGQTCKFMHSLSHDNNLWINFFKRDRREDLEKALEGKFLFGGYMNNMRDARQSYKDRAKQYSVGVRWIEIRIEHLQRAKEHMQLNLEYWQHMIEHVQREQERMRGSIT